MGPGRRTRPGIMQTVEIKWTKGLRIILMLVLPILTGGHSHGHSHSHSHSHGRADPPTSALEKFCVENPQLAATLATFVISLSSLCIMPILPLLDDQEKIMASDVKIGKGERVLKMMLSFAVGALLGDVFLHLIPGVLSDLCTKGEDLEWAAFSALGLPLLCGMFVFFLSEKAMNAAYDHSHQSQVPTRPPGSPKRGRRASRTKRSSSPKRAVKAQVKPASGFLQIDNWRAAKPAAWLNLAADALHNFTDGLALGVTFANGAGIPTTVAVFFHEVPHNLADFAILVQNGLSRKDALLLQFISSTGAMVGCLAGFLLPTIAELPGFVAGGFLYLALTGIVPSLQSDRSHPFEQAAFMVLGVLLMTQIH